MEDWRSIIARQDAAREQEKAKRHAIEEQARVLKEQTQRREADTLTLALNAYKIKEKLEYIQKGVWKVGDIQEYEPTFLRANMTSPEMYKRSPRSDLSEFYKNITFVDFSSSGSNYCYSPSSRFKSGGYRLSFKYQDVGQGSNTNEWGIAVSSYEYIDDDKEASIAVWINIRDNMPWLINVRIDNPRIYDYAPGENVGFADDRISTGGILNVFLTDFPENVITEDSQLQLILARDCEKRATKHKLPLELQQIGAKNVSKLRERRKASKPKSFWQKFLG